MARDPVGVRPWYQPTSGPRSAGASDVATLCALPWVDDGVDEVMALAYLATAQRAAARPCTEASRRSGQAPRG